MQIDDIRTVVAETLAEQKRIQSGEIDAIVLKTIATVLTSFGIDEDDRRELRADLGYLRRWRKSVEQAKNYTFRAVITVIVTGVLGAMWLGIKTIFGK
jgi:hypothetical protein